MTEPGYDFPVVVNGRWTVRMPSHRALRYLHEGDWEKERLASMALNIGKGDVLWDIGAEQGDMSALFAQWLHGAVYLVEPNPLAWPTIRACWKANGLPMPPGWFVGFASDTDAGPTGGEERAQQWERDSQPAHDGWPSCAYGDVVAGAGFRHLAEETSTTPQARLDKLAERWGRPPTAITIDVEGAELRVLRGTERTLRQHRPLVWVSVHPEFMRHHFGERPRQLLDFMEDDVDYRPIHLGDDHESHWFFEPR